MSETKKYYLGTGTEFNKKQCKEYKTLDGALKAAAKDESLVVWDEDGNVIGSVTDNVPDGALTPNADGSINAYDADGNKVGTVDADTVKEITGNPEEGAEGAGQAAGDTEGAGNASNDGKQENEPPAQNNGQNGENKASEGTGQATGIANEEVGKFNVVVVCDGSLRLRRSASWDNANECGRALKGQTYVGKRIFMLDGLPMLETIDGLFMSAANEHVKIEKV